MLDKGVTDELDGLGMSLAQNAYYVDNEPIIVPENDWTGRLTEPLPMLQVLGKMFC
jgi:hypothetical protein